MAHETKFEDRFKEIGAIWVKDKGVLSFSLKDDVSIKSGDSIVGFKNKFKSENAKAPDYRLFRDTEPKQVTV